MAVLTRRGTPLKYQVCIYCQTPNKKPKAKTCDAPDCKKRLLAEKSRRNWLAKRGPLKHPVCIFCQSTDKRPEAKVCRKPECYRKLKTKNQRRYTAKRLGHRYHHCSECDKQLGFLDHGRSAKKFYCKPCRAEIKRLEERMRRWKRKQLRESA